VNVVIILLILIAFVLSQFERVRLNLLVYRIVMGILALLVLLAIFRWLVK
jgi:hypothetical protein